MLYSFIFAIIQYILDKVVNNMKTIKCDNGKFVNVSPLSKNTLRIRVNNEDNFEETSGPVRYGIYNMTENGQLRTFTHNEKEIFETDNVNLTFNTKTFSFSLINKLIDTKIECNNIYKSEKSGFKIDIETDTDEKFYGLGDTTREIIQKRGTIADIWVKNVKSYVPIPFLVSSKYYAIFSNTTYRQIFDICKTDENTLSIWGESGELDIILFVGANYNDLLLEYGKVTGMPNILPQFAYGLTFVCNMENTAKDMVDDMLNLRREGIPCDVIGLEPKWMSKYYDNTVNKKFDDERFFIPPWAISESMNGTFFGVINQLGFKLSLWLCCDYDLSYEEERNAIIKKEEIKSQIKDDYLPSMDDYEKDQTIGHHPISMDKVTVKEEPWFEHLKKFTDYGAKAFKLDGAWQVNEHPDRLYGNNMTDAQMHNLYPLILNKQMALGYEEHTKTRSMIYSSGGYAGIQQYAATWAGDTGGGPKPLVSMLNNAFSGHTNTSCDMIPFTKEGIHFGFLQSWSQLCSWAYWRHPWLLGQPLKQIYKDYARFRYSLIPYIYSAAYQAHLFGNPIMRPLPFVYPNDTKVDNIKTQYMFGDNFLVSCFSEYIYLPEGKWIDYYSKKQYDGPYEGKLDIPEDKGGGLFIKAGGIIPFWPQVDYVGEKKIEKLKLEIYPYKESSYILYEDDGISLDYKNNTRCETTITCNEKDSITINVSKRVGTYKDMVQNRFYEINVYSQTDRYVTVNNESINTIFKDNFIKFDIDCTNRDCEIIIK